MAQLADYRAAIRLLGYDGATDAQVDAAIQQARRRIFADYRWSFLEADNAALSTSVDDATVSLATVTDLAHLDSVRLLSEPEPLEWRPYQLLRDIRQNYPDDTGPPRYWTRHKGELLFYPTPDAAYALDIVYVSYPGDLPAATDDVIPDARQDLVTWASVPPLAFRQRDFKASGAAEAHYAQTLLPRHAAQDGTEQRQTSRQVRSGYWD